MKKNEMKKQIVGTITTKLKMGFFNAALKDSLSDSDRETFCNLERELADQIDKKYKTNSYSDRP